MADVGETDQALTLTLLPQLLLLMQKQRAGTVIGNVQAVFVATTLAAKPRRGGEGGEGETPARA